MDGQPETKASSSELSDEEVSSQAESRSTSQLSSGTQIVYEEEECERIYVTKRDRRAVRMLKTWRCIPRKPTSITYAEVGLQVSSTDKGDQLKKVHELRSQLDYMLVLMERYLKQQHETKKGLDELEAVVDRLLQTEKELESRNKDNQRLEKQLQDKNEEILSQINMLKSQLEISKGELEQQQKTIQEQEETIKHMQTEKDKVNCEMENLVSSLERSELNCAFLQDERGDAQKALQESTTQIQQLHDKLAVADKGKRDYQALYVHSRARSSEILGVYLQELNRAIEEKRLLLQGYIDANSKDVKKILVTNDEYLKLQTEKNKLLEQVENLSAQTVGQDMKIEDLEEMMASQQGRHVTPPPPAYKRVSQSPGSPTKMSAKTAVKEKMKETMGGDNHKDNMGMGRKKSDNFLSSVGGAQRSPRGLNKSLSEPKSAEPSAIRHKIRGIASDYLN